MLIPDPGPLVIVGAGGFGRECLDIVVAVNAVGGNLDFVGFLDDGEVDEGLLAARGTRLVGQVGSGPNHAERYVIAIGSGVARSMIDLALSKAGMQGVAIVHPQATLGSECRIAPGVILNAGARVTTNVTLGRHVQIHANATVGHDARLDDYVSVYPGATISGAVHLGAGVTVGTGANVLPGVTVGAGVTIGAGAVVVRDIAPGTVVVGVPAAPIARSH